jgi:hypothetical protein
MNIGKVHAKGNILRSASGLGVSGQVVFGFAQSIEVQQKILYISQSNGFVSVGMG